MIRNKLFIGCALALAFSIAGTPASAQQPRDQLTYFTFSAPFELPGGKVLPAGKYVFRIMDSPSNRHVVQVLSEDESQMHATLFAIPAQRQEPAAEPEIRFMEAEATAAPAIRTWWYPGRVIGHEFIYPKDHARRLAARQSEGVLTVAGDNNAAQDMADGELARIGADGREAAWQAATTADNRAQQSPRENQNAPAASQTPQSGKMTGEAASETATAPPSPQQPASQAVQEATATPRTAEAAPRRSAQPANNGENADAAAERASDSRAAAQGRTELPRTAGSLPLVALLGLGSLLGAGVLRLRRS